MSCQTIIWALRQRGLSAPERVVLMYLADKANGALVCWPSIETICEAIELSDKTVRRAVQRLAELHLIRIQAKHRHNHHYHILHPTNGLDGDPTQPEVGDIGPVYRSEIPPNAYIPPSYRSGLPVTITAKTEVCRSELPVNEPVLPVRITEYPPKKEGRKERKKETGAKGSRLGGDWTPSPGCIAFAESKGLNAEAVADEFRDYWIARAGQGACKLDWEATFRNRCRDIAERNAQRAPQPKPGKLDHLIKSIMAYQPATGHA
jgi:hypothetical protein